jgi:hypothetical protein
MIMWSLALVGVALALFGGMLFLMEVGRRLGRRQPEEHEARPGKGAIEAAVFALLGLLLAFQFSRASGRLDARRELAVREANAIGTAYLRLDLLRPSDQAPLRDLFRAYVDARVRSLDGIPGRGEAEEATQQLQREIWARAVAATRGEPPVRAQLLLPALNDMIDVTTSRAVAGQTHAPVPIVVLLYAVALLSALLAGFAMSAAPHRSIFHMFLFAGATALTVFVILDLEYPRAGLIRIGAADAALRALPESMR